MMVCLPIVNADVMNVACPLLSRKAVPSVVAPSVKETVPAGVPPIPLTVATKVTGWPNVLGFGVEANVVTAVVAVTFWVSVVLLPENKSGSVGT